MGGQYFNEPDWSGCYNYCMHYLQVCICLVQIKKNKWSPTVAYMPGFWGQHEHTNFVKNFCTKHRSILGQAPRRIFELKPLRSVLKPFLVIIVCQQHLDSVVVMCGYSIPPPIMANKQLHWQVGVSIHLGQRLWRLTLTLKILPYFTRALKLFICLNLPKSRQSFKLLLYTKICSRTCAICWGSLHSVRCNRCFK